MIPGAPDEFTLMPDDIGFIEEASPAIARIFVACQLGHTRCIIS